MAAVEEQADEGGEETTVSKVVKKTTKTTVVSATEGYIAVFINRNDTNLLYLMTVSKKRVT